MRKYAALDAANKRARELIGDGCEDCEHAEASHNEYGCTVKVPGPSADDHYCSCIRLPSNVVAENVRRAIEDTPCSRHPRYKALRRPTSQCEDCWAIWLDAERERAYACC